MKKQTDTFKRLRAVMKDINGDHRQIIKTMQSGKFVEISKIVKKSLPQTEYSCLQMGTVC